ncbi:MAG TPA: glycosyltransferase family 2 protein [Thermoanaerobaculia bacterium]|nr:glycosyltransferase family 2 protein [Thermoanaerobaculia bacterium]
MPSISVVVPTFNGGPDLVRLCRHLQLLRMRLDLDVLVIDSSSTDGSTEHARRAGLRVHSISQKEFGHGRTRNLGVQMTRGDIVCFLTQDVLPCTPDWPLRFAAALDDPSVAGVYGRQVPRDARTTEMFFVSRNYPLHPKRFDPQPGGHHPRPGSVLFSNAFSAVRRADILAVPYDDVPVSEDQIWAQQQLMRGKSIVYEPRAEALHAHHYTLRGLFQRTFLVGQALRMAGMDRGATLPEAAAFLVREIAYLIRQGHTHRLPGVLIYEFVRWFGFQVGRRRAPRSIG